MRTTATERNREIFAGFKAGMTVIQLAEHYGLASATIAGVLSTERLKFEVSVDAFYSDLRRSPVPQC